MQKANKNEVVAEPGAISQGEMSVCSGEALKGRVMKGPVGIRRLVINQAR